MIRDIIQATPGRMLALLVSGVLIAQTVIAEQVVPPKGTKLEPKAQAVTASKRGLTNIARNKPYRLKPAPNYKHCVDPGDKTQLTDGKYVTDYFWVQKGTVGWSHTGIARITIDLGKVEPIRGVSFNTAAGTAGVGWPGQVSIFVSEDGKDYHSVGDLVELSAARGLPEPLGYRTHTYWTDKFQTKGRFVQIAVVLGSSYAFCDEIEVWRGDDAWLSRPVGGKKVGNVAKYLRTAAATSCVRRRMRMDAATIRQAVKSSKMSAEQQAAAIKKLDDLAKQIGGFHVEDPSKLRAVVPLNDLHSRILAVNAEVLRARGLKGLVVWHKNRWDPLGVLEAPESPPTELPKISVRMMLRESRAATLNLTNAGDTMWRGLVKLEGLPVEKAARMWGSRYVAIAVVEHVDTKQGVVVADALSSVPMLPMEGLVTIPPGTTKQVWLTFRFPSRVWDPILHRSEWRCLAQIKLYSVSLDDANAPKISPAIHSVPLHLRVADIKFPKHPSLSLGTWDYTNHPPYHRGLTARNVKAAIADAKAHFVDSPWATNSVMPFPQKSQLDADGNLKVKTLDFSKFDDWHADWRDYARRYMIFSNVPKSIAGFAMGTPDFNRVVGQWYTAWADHCKELGIKRKAVALLIRDEPHEDSQYRHIAAWAKAIKAATNYFSIWEDPVDRKLGTAAQTATLEMCDAICPNLGIYNRLGKRAEDYYAKLVAGGKRELWFYQCTGPVRLLDPYGYHRLQAWHCWVHGAVGQGFWAYADAGNGNPWCEYLCGGTTYCPAYVGPDRITTSKHWEAVREGIEDYEYLHMLEQRIDVLTKAGKSSPALDKAKKLLADGPKRVATYNPISWFGKEKRDRSLADKVRVEILDTLVALSGK